MTRLGEVITLTVAPEDDGVRLDRWLRRRWPHLGQGQIEKLARGGQLRVDGGRVRAQTRLAAGARVRVPPLPGAFDPADAPAPLDPRQAAFARSLVLFEDDQVLVLNKPSGLAVQGGSKTARHVDALLSAWGEGEGRPRLAHRLDRDTSGVLVLGKTAAAASRLAAAFADRSAAKTYWALVEGCPEPPAGVIEIPLAKSGQADRERMAPAPPGQGLAAVTDYVTRARAAAGVAWMELRPRTGRTHQLRAHMLHLGHPILGDRKYATAASLALSEGLALQLHARRLTMPHPAGGVLDIEAPLGEAIAAGFARFGLDPAARTAKLT